MPASLPAPTCVTIEIPGEEPRFIVKASTTCQMLLDLCDLYASSEETILLQGDTGTGKDSLARYIHTKSRRRAGPFVEFNCADATPTIFESLLFGHGKGAFTGAVAERRSPFELADGGTLFINEIGELPLELQLKFLRVVQEKEIQRVGDLKRVKVDTRLIVATLQDLEALVAGRRFRPDLFYRLNVLPIHVPPLRDHIADIPYLVRHFLERANLTNKFGDKPISEEGLNWLMRRDWQGGNVRELKNLVTRAYVNAREDTIIDINHLIEGETSPGGGKPQPGPSAGAKSDHGSQIEPDRLPDERRSQPGLSAGSKSDHGSQAASHWVESAESLLRVTHLKTQVARAFTQCFENRLSRQYSELLAECVKAALRVMCDAPKEVRHIKYRTGIGQIAFFIGLAIKAGLTSQEVEALVSVSGASTKGVRDWRHFERTAGNFKRENWRGRAEQLRDFIRGILG
jgi:DNA-binding NtrC family response regulator